MAASGDTAARHGNLEQGTDMQTHVIISYDGTDNDKDALALGAIFGDAGARISLAYVRHTTESDEAAERAAQAHAEEILETGAQWLGHPEVARHIVLSGSTGEGLWALAEREGADLLVFGSDWHTAPRHVQPGPSALRLIDGGPVAVAIASAGLRDRGMRALRTVAIAGGEFDDAAHATANQLAELSGNALALPSDERLDLLVIGSRPGTPEGRVGISAASEYLVETARASVLIVARGVALHPAESAAPQHARQH
jgi:nucleotide-binding universal stress UspA family protein